MSEIIIMFGILGTFIGFYVSFEGGGAIDSGVGVAMMSSIVGLTLGIFFMLLEKFLASDVTAIHTESMFKDSIELIWDNQKYQKQLKPFNRNDKKKIYY